MPANRGAAIEGALLARFGTIFPNFPSYARLSAGRFRFWTFNMSTSKERQLLLYVLRGDMAAIEMCEQLFRISQVLDDLVDGDKPVTGSAIIETFWCALIDLPANPFYRRHEPTIRPLMAAALQDWTDATRMERGDDHHGKTLAFVLRDQLTSLVVQVAGIIGGYQWMQNVSEQIRRFFHDEPIAEYINNLPASEAEPEAS